MTEKRKDTWTYVLLGTCQHPVQKGILTAYITSCSEERAMGGSVFPFPHHITSWAESALNPPSQHDREYTSFVVVAINLRSGSVYTIPSKSIETRRHVVWS